MNWIRQKNLCLKMTIVVYHNGDIKSNAIGTNPISAGCEGENKEILDGIEATPEKKRRR